MTDNSCNFCLLYHLKGVCNTHCGFRNSHKPLYQSEFRKLGEWSKRFCGRDKAPPVRKVDTGD